VGLKYLITGGGRGLGYEYAKYLCTSGQDKVFVVVRQRSNSPSFIDPKSVFELDFNTLTDKTLDDFSDWIGEIAAPDVVIHCAGGGLGLRSPIPSYLDIQKMLNSNLVGAIAINSIILPKFVNQRRGTIVHVGSTASTHAVGSVAYNTAKAGLAAYVRSAGNHFVRHEVLVCGINPGAFLAYDNSMSRLKSRSNDIYDKFIQEKLPRREMMPLDDVFKVLDFLSREPNLSLAGSMIAIDAGESLAYP